MILTKIFSTNKISLLNGKNKIISDKDPIILDIMSLIKFICLLSVISIVIRSSKS